MGRITLIDTNVLIFYLRKQLPIPANTFISIISVGELRSFARRNNWGIKRLEMLDKLIAENPIIDIELNITENYAAIETFSQGLDLNKPLLSSARNMGKNDLWLAATAMYYDIDFCTTDSDFDHLLTFGLKLIKFES